MFAMGRLDDRGPAVRPPILAAQSRVQGMMLLRVAGIGIDSGRSAPSTKGETCAGHSPAWLSSSRSRYARRCAGPASAGPDNRCYGEIVSGITTTWPWAHENRVAFPPPPGSLALWLQIFGPDLGVSTVRDLRCSSAASSRRGSADRGGAPPRVPPLSLGRSVPTRRPRPGPEREKAGWASPESAWPSPHPRSLAAAWRKRRRAR